MAGRTRSPNYPNTSLATAIDSARKFYGKAQQATVHPDDAVKAMGYQGPSGASRSRLAALRQYGLVDDVKDGVRLTELGLTLLHPQSDDELVIALSRAALTPPLFKELWGTHKNADASVVASHLIRTKHFSQAGAQQAAESFKANADLVKASPEGYSSPDAPRDQPEREMSLSELMPSPARSARTVRWQNTVTLGDDLVAELRVISGRPLRVGDLRRIRRLLDTNIDTGIEAMEEGDDAGEGSTT
jgi:hypothetical protein